MPRKAKGARLHLRPERRNKDGAITHHATWVIRDGTGYHATGCLEREVEAAEQRLQEYIALKYAPKRKEQDIEVTPVSDVLSIYVDDRPDLYDEKQNELAKRFCARIDRLNAYFGRMMLAQITGEACRGYAKHRGNAGGARRDLEDLRSAINHHAKEGLHRGVVRVLLPRKGLPRDRWLTRPEAARLLWACWRTREVQRGVPTDKRPLRHLARFILIGLYSGTRAGAIASASPMPAIGRSYVDLDRGIFYRLATGRRATNKKQPPVPLPPRLLNHMRRWKARGKIAKHFVEFNGEAVKSVKTGFARAARLAELEGRVSPHTLRHTSATWTMQSGADLWQAAGWLGMSIETLQRVYGHHHPDFMSDVLARVGSKPKGVSVAVTEAVGL
jgi:integrase